MVRQWLANKGFTRALFYSVQTLAITGDDIQSLGSAKAECLTGRMYNLYIHEQLAGQT